MRKQQMVSLWVRQDFEAAHNLDGIFPHHHQCARMHGHRYSVTLTITTQSDADVVVDYHDLHAGLRAILSRYDHRCLNDVMSSPPTCENLAREILAAATARWPQAHAVEVQEQAHTGCVVSR